MVLILGDQRNKRTKDKNCYIKFAKYLVKVPHNYDYGIGEKFFLLALARYLRIETFPYNNKKMKIRKKLLSSLNSTKKFRSIMLP